MATDRQIVKASNEFEEAQQLLADLRDKKKVLQDQLAATQSRIDEQQVVLDALRLNLKTLVNEL